MSIWTPEKEETVSTMSATSGYFASVQQISGKRIHDAGRGFAVDQDDGVEFSGGESGIDLLGIDVFAPFDLERLGVFAATFGDIEPFVGERAAHAAEDAAIDQIADRRLHHAPGGGGGEKDRLFGAEQGSAASGERRGKDS